MPAKSVTKSVTPSAFVWWSPDADATAWADNPEEIQEDDPTRRFNEGRPPENTVLGSGFLKPYPRLTCSVAGFARCDGSDALLKTFISIAEKFAEHPTEAKRLILSLARQFGPFCVSGKNAFQQRSLHDHDVTLLSFDGWVQAATVIHAGATLTEALGDEVAVPDLIQDIRERAALEIDVTRSQHITPTVWYGLWQLLDGPLRVGSALIDPRQCATLDTRATPTPDEFRETLIAFFLERFNTTSEFSMSYVDGKFTTNAVCGAGSWACYLIAQKLQGGSRAKRCDECDGLYFPGKKDGKLCSDRCRQAKCRKAKALTSVTHA